MSRSSCRSFLQEISFVAQEMLRHVKSMFLRSFHLAIACVILFGTIPFARATINLSNFSAAHPVKIMPIGDSITDDCEFTGAWRAFLQTLLDTNGYPFTFVGRNITSGGLASFTKKHHEGYCGAVIAQPGVLGSAVYGYAGTNVYLDKIVPDALAIATNTPDIILLLIGANDIGRGRDPLHVATNDMPQLLDIIFSNAPNANVILAKITSLTGASLPGLNYGAFSTNVYPYNAALEAMVNQRRALGQNVSLADMFSVVNPANMFMSDHLHPNMLGLQTMAQEWFTRIQAITVRSNQFTTTLIHGGEDWKYNDTGQDLGANWAQDAFDDSGWSNGVAPLGYGLETIATPVSFGTNTANRNITTYFRHSFIAPEHGVLTNLQFRLERVDGAVVWLNGQEAFRSNMPSGPISYTTLASTTVAFDPAYTFYTNILPATNVVSGTNTVAAEIHLRVASKTTMGLNMELLGSGYTIPTPTLQFSNGNAQLAWPVNTSTNFSLYSTTNLASGNWTNANAPTQTNSGQVTASVPQSGVSQFFRLQIP